MLNRGSTLIEVLMYTTIYMIVVGGMMIYAYAMLTSAQRADTQVEVVDNARFITQKMQRVLQGATAINSPAIGSSASSLSINTATTSWNPLVVDVASGSLRFKRGSSAPVPISNSFVTISSVSFKNYSYSTATKNTIRMKAQISSVDPFALSPSTSIDIFISLQ